MALVKVMLPPTGMVEVLTGPQYVRFVEACTTKLLPAGPESTNVKLVLPAATRDADRMTESVNAKEKLVAVTVPAGAPTPSPEPPSTARINGGLVPQPGREKLPTGVPLKYPVKVFPEVA